MKRTQAVELFCDIRNSIVSFFSILMFVALGVGVFLGISWVGPALENAADKLFDEGRFHNFQVQFVYGLTDEDLAKLSQVQGVSQVEAERQSFQTLRQGGMHYVVKVQSLGQEIDVPLVVEGELPERPGEVALHAKSASTLGIAVGDTLTFEHDVSADGTQGQVGDSATGPDGRQPDTSDGMQYLAGDTFKVTALVNSAEYMANLPETYGYSNKPSGAVDVLAWVPDATFDAAAFQDGFPVVNVVCESLAGLGTFTSAYDQASDAIQERVSTLGADLAKARYDSLHDNAQAKVDDAEKQLSDAKAQIADGEKQVKDGEAQLEQARKDLDQAVADGEAKLASAREQLETGEEQLFQAAAELDEARAKLNDGLAKLNELDEMKAQAQLVVQDMEAYESQLNADLAVNGITQEEFNKSLDEYGAQLGAQVKPFAKRAGVPLPTINHATYDEAITLLRGGLDDVENATVDFNGEQMTVAEARVRAVQAEQQIADGQALYDEKSAELAQGWSDYNAGQEELATQKAQGEQKIADGEAELEKAKKELQNAKDEVAKNEPKLDEAKQMVAALKEFEWSVMPRSYNGGNVQVSTFSAITNNLAVSMAALFIVVGLLVSYFAVSRLVHEQVSQIGTKKALGFRRGEITRSFLLYSGIAVLAGALIGAVVGYTVVEGIIIGTLGTMFAFGDFPAYFGLPLFLAMVAIELVLILGATYLACRSILKRHAVELLRGDKPPTGKARFYEKWGIWEKLPLFVQTIVNNCVNDKRRMLSTIVGVAGSTALIVTAITLNNDVMKSYDLHYQDVYGFDAIAYVESEPQGAVGDVEAALQGEGATTARVFMKRYLMKKPDGTSDSMRIVVPLETEVFGQVYHVNPVSEGTPNLAGEGAWVSQAYRDHMGAKVGDVIVIDGGDGKMHEVPILGFYEFWLTYHEMVMGSDYYQKEFGDVVPNTVLAQMRDASLDDMRPQLAEIEGFDSIVDDADYQYGNFRTFSSVSGAVVAIYLALAAIMAVVVLLNLNVMFIEEKKRELIVLMINGFSVKDAKRYIFYDNIVLTALGIALGVVLGCIMGSATVSSIEPSTATFWKGVDGWAVGIGIAGSAVLALVMSVIALRRIPRFRLTDINKL